MILKGIKEIASSIILSAIISFGFNYFNLFYSANWWWSLILFAVIFITLNVLYNYKTDPKSSSDILIGTISVKTLLLLMAIFLYSLFDKKGLFSFSMHFIAHYILFTVFEIRYLLSKIKNEPNKK